MGQPEYTVGQNDPYQEPPKPELTLGEALATIARRTAFSTEHERDAVYAALAKLDSPERADSDEPGDDEPGEDSTPKPVKAAKSTPGRSTR